MYLKKYIKEIALGLILIVCIFLVLANTSSSKNVVLVKKVAIDIPIEKNPPLLIERYSANDTKNVRHKLDSLLERINKRHDFNGAVLVAKNKKILYSNQIGIADFKNKSLLNKESVFQLASVSKQIIFV